MISTLDFAIRCNDSRGNTDCDFYVIGLCALYILLLYAFLSIWLGSNAVVGDVDVGRKVAIESFACMHKFTFWSIVYDSQ